ncbi:hypothetical protein ACIRPK_07285 [Kitasatospora sp. NPDC101801]|uniref:hypothetical protein n=1 Tax=Kitasatospora sp. NPDC101801 TaxID=3364103 RepID=UPI003824819B
MSDDDTMPYSRLNTLAGLLQRGRGFGARAALQNPQAAAPLVYDAIRRDWRWDSTDDRALYLARLLRDLKLSPAPVVDLLTGSQEQCGRAVHVLVLLAVGGCDEAREALRRYVREGAHWVSALESLSHRWPLEWWEDLGEVARARIGAEAERPWLTEPWTRFGIEVEGPDPGPIPLDLTGLSDGELLDLLAAPDLGASGRVNVLRELCRRDPVEGLLPLVPSLGTPDGRRPVPWLRRAVDRLGALAVPAARRWVCDERPWLAGLGADVLADHPGPEAIPALVSELADQRGARAWCGPDTTARRLARFGPAATAAVPDLRWFWLRTPHSYERTAYLKALAAIGTHGLDHAHTESLWDCEGRARLLGIAHAPGHPETLERIAALRDDPMEEPEVRAAARTRLTPTPHRDRHRSRPTAVRP